MITTFMFETFLSFKQNKARKILERVKKKSEKTYLKIIGLLDSSLFMKYKEDLMQNRKEIEECIKSDIHSFYCNDSDIKTLCYLCVPSLR